MDATEKRLQRRQLKAAQRTDGTTPHHEKVEDMRRLQAKHRVEPTPAQLERSAARKRVKAAQRIEPPAPDARPLSLDKPNRDIRGMVLGAMLLMSPFAYWLSESEQQAGPGSVPGQTSSQLESESRQERIEQLERETAALRETNRRTEQDNLNRDAQRLSDALRSQGIGISPTEARALLQTEQELTDR